MKISRRGFIGSLLGLVAAARGNAAPKEITRETVEAALTTKQARALEREPFECCEGSCDCDASAIKPRGPVR